MKVLGWILFFTIATAQAQQLIEPAPLSVEDDGTRKIIENGGKPAAKPELKSSDVIAPPPAKAITMPNDEVLNPTTPEVPEPKKGAKKVAVKKVIIKDEKVAAPVEPVVMAPVVPVNPQDGQIKLDPAQPKAIDKNPDVQNIEVLAFEYYDSPLKKYLQFSFGYINSKYSKVHPDLENGSVETAFKFVSDVTRNYQVGFAVEILSDTSDKKIPDNIRSLQYRLFVDYHAPLYQRGSLKMDWVGGLSFSIGDYGIKRRFRGPQGEETSVSLKDGTIIGLIPAGGIRFYLVGQNSVDIMFEYHQYFGNPQRYIGGLAISPRINFEF